MGLATQSGGEGGAAALRVVQSFLPGTGIGETGIDQQGARHGLREMRARHGDRCGAKTILSEYGGGLGPGCTFDYHQIAPIRFANVGTCHAEANAGDYELLVPPVM